VFGALRGATVDLYYQSIRLVPANLAWGATVLVLGWIAVSIGIGLALLGTPVLAVPLVGVYRLAGHVTRREEVVLSDAWTAMRERWVAALAIGAALVVAAVLLGTNIQIGLESDSPLGWAFATVAGWTLVATVIYAIVVWPLLADPDRRAVPARAAARLAGLVVLAAPIRVAGLALVVVALGIVSTILFALVLSISIAYIALLSCRVVLPEADRLAERLAERETR